MIDDIFNRAGYNNLSQDDKENIAKYPAFEIFMKNSYSMEQLEASHPKEYKILTDMHLEAALKSNLCEELLKVYHDFVFDCLLKDKNILAAIMIYKEKEFKEFGEKGEKITEKYLKLGDEFEATLNKP